METLIKNSGFSVIWFVASARQLAKALEVPLVNDLRYTKRYVRCLQISEVTNSMKDLIDYSREIGTGPIESLAKFPRRTVLHLGSIIKLHNLRDSSSSSNNYKQYHRTQTVIEVQPKSNANHY
ncbi:hypothetical protein D5086_002119 [Populus alba]|uniref:Uncharacterized protein n=1 Tax=Populus alba TaxID=43335 RepID=A0ACC4D152_POPAL